MQRFGSLGNDGSSISSSPHPEAVETTASVSCSNAELSAVIGALGALSPLGQDERCVSNTTRTVMATESSVPHSIVPSYCSTDRKSGIVTRSTAAAAEVVFFDPDDDDDL